MTADLVHSGSMERTDEITLAQRIEAGVLAQELLATGDGQVEATPAELAELVAQGSAARDELILAHLGLVGTIAGEVARRRRLPFDDLFQEGCLAVQQAVMRYDWRKGAFGPYAAIWIRAMVRSFKTTHWSPLDDVDLEDHRVQDHLEHIDDRVSLTAVLELTPQQVGYVLKSRVGWEGKPRTRQQVGEDLGLTPAMVRQIERDGLRQIRQRWGC